MKFWIIKVWLYEILAYFPISIFKIWLYGWKKVLNSKHKNTIINQHLLIMRVQKRDGTPLHNLTPRQYSPWQGWNWRYLRSSSQACSRAPSLPLRSSLSILWNRFKLSQTILERILLKHISCILHFICFLNHFKIWKNIKLCTKH